MQTHENAALTVRQREQVQQAVHAGSASYRELATRYGVNLSTIQRWARRPSDQPRRLGAHPAAVAARRATKRPSWLPAQPWAGAYRPRPVNALCRCPPRTVLALLQAHGLTRGTRPKKEARQIAGEPAPGADGRAVSA